MKDRVVNTNPRRYELVSRPADGTGSHGGAFYDMYIGYTPDTAGTPQKASVILSDTVAQKYGLNIAQTDYTTADFASPNNAFRDVWKYIYPVGSIFQTINPALNTAASVMAQFGGTWVAWGAGKFPVGYLNGDADFGTVGGTGGFKALQKHTHALNHGHTVETSGALTADANTVGLSTSTVADHTHTTPDHTHSTGSESTGHLHGLAVSGTTSTGGSHDHAWGYKSLQLALGSSWQYTGSTTDPSSGDFIWAGGSHAHTVTSYGTSGDIDRLHTHSIGSSGAGTSGYGGTHSHTISPHQHNIPTHTHTITSASFTTDENGQVGGAVSGATNGNLPPFIVCYQYVRTL